METRSRRGITTINLPQNLPTSVIIRNKFTCNMKKKQQKKKLKKNSRRRRLARIMVREKFIGSGIIKKKQKKT